METQLKLKVISRNASSRTKGDSRIVLPLTVNRNKENETRSSQLKFSHDLPPSESRTLLSSQSSKSLYKQRYQQCEERLGEENSYLRQHVISLHQKVAQAEADMQQWNLNKAKLQQEKSGMEAEISSLREVGRHRQSEVFEATEAMNRMRSEHTQEVTSLMETTSQLKQCICEREECIRDSENRERIVREDLDRLLAENRELRQQLGETSMGEASVDKICITENTFRNEKKRAKSTYKDLTFKQPRCEKVPTDLSPKEAARMDVLLEEFTELKATILKGNLDSATAFRLVTLIQYLKQTLAKKNLEIAGLKESRQPHCNEFRLSETIDKYERALLSSRQQIENLEYEIQALKASRSESNEEERVFEFGFRDNFRELRSSSRRLRNERAERNDSSSKKSLRKKSFLKSIQDFDCSSREQENLFKEDLRLAQNHNYRQSAKRDMFQKFDVTNTIFKDVKISRRASGILNERKEFRNSSVSIPQKYNYVYTKSPLNEYLKTNQSLIVYMTLVVKITELIDKSLKGGSFRPLSTKEVLVLNCEGVCPESMRIKCQLRLSDEQIETEYVSPEGESDESGVMWSIGMVFRQIFQSIQPEEEEEEELFRSIVRPQFLKILESLLVENKEKRMRMGEFKTMLTKLS